MPPNVPNMGAANALTGKKYPVCGRLFLLPLIYQKPGLTASFLILKSHLLLVLCYMFCEVE